MASNQLPIRDRRKFLTQVGGGFDLPRVRASSVQTFVERDGRAAQSFQGHGARKIGELRQPAGPVQRKTADG